VGGWGGLHAWLHDVTLRRALQKLVADTSWWACVAPLRPSEAAAGLDAATLNHMGGALVQHASLKYLAWCVDESSEVLDAAELVAARLDACGMEAGFVAEMAQAGTRIQGQHQEIDGHSHSCLCDVWSHCSITVSRRRCH